MTMPITMARPASIVLLPLRIAPSSLPVIMSMTVMVMPVFMLLLPLAFLSPVFQPRQRLRNLLALLLHQVLLHRIIVIMLPQQFL